MKRRVSTRRCTRIAAAGAAGLALMMVAPVMAHTGVQGTSGFAAGLLHPPDGIDHVLAMVAVGAWAGLLGARSLWAVPGAFLGAMLAGAAVAILGLPGVQGELAIAASVIALGLLVALGARAPLGIAVMMIATFGTVHGYAHGSELAGGGAVPYMAGFAATTLALHGLGVVVVRRAIPPLALRTAGLGIAAAGVMLL